MPPLAPPIKCQGIKTKLVTVIKSAVDDTLNGQWVEPFCGSGVIAFNIKPQRAILADTNHHIINFYSSLQNGSLTPGIVAKRLEIEGEKLRTIGECHYYDVRDRFNKNGHPLDFLFLNRACFNGVVRFNKKGEFNVPFCRKPNRFSKAYITKITNQVRAVCDVMRERDWTFEVADFRTTLTRVNHGDLVYADPPYIGRHADYFNQWTDEDERDLIEHLKRLSCKFVLSTWQQNKYRQNRNIEEHWQNDGLKLISVKHFYHVGASETLRHEMVEAVITNCDFQSNVSQQNSSNQMSLSW
jgi:DNA adenine methylase